MRNPIHQSQMYIHYSTFVSLLVPSNQTFNVNGNDISGNNGGGPQTAVHGTGVINP